MKKKKVRGAILGLLGTFFALLLINSGIFASSKVVEFKSPAHGLKRTESEQPVTLQPLTPPSHEHVTRIPVIEPSSSERVKPASHQFSIPVAALVGQFGTDNRPLAVVDVTSQTPTNLTWPLTKNDEKILVRSQQIRLLVPGKDDEKVKVRRVTNGTSEFLLKGNPASWGKDHPVNAVHQVVELRNMDIPLDAGTATKVVVDKATPGSQPLTVSSVLVQTPPVTGPTPPSITRIANGKNGDAIPIDVAVRGGYDLYGVGAYLRVVGQNHPPGGKLRFFRATANDADKINNETIQIVEELTPRQQPSVPGGAWSAELIVPDNPRSGHIVVLGETQNGVPYHFAHPFAYTVQSINADATLPVAPGVSGVRVGGGSRNALNDVYPINQTEMEVTVAIGNSGAEFPKHSQIVVYPASGSSPAALGHVTVTNATSGPIRVPVKGLKQGRQDLVVTIERGDGHTLDTRDVKPAISQPFTVAVRTGGLTVEKVTPEDFGAAPGYSSLTVFFDKEHQLSATSAAPQNTDAYKLLGSRGTGAFDRGTEQSFTATTAVYDEKENSVRLSFSGITPDVYQLRIIGTEIEDIYGNQLEGESGEPGTDYITVLGKVTRDAELAQRPSARPGITGATGKYVPYPEFTAPREVPSGFNPHDKVETRVARLYYYRDAHRVAQIINRRVRSYNRAGVDMQRQLADKARTLADQTTAARQAAERKAIDKAEATRRVENQLRSAQRSLDQTLNELTTARRLGEPENTVQTLDRAAQNFARQIQTLQDQVEHAREREIEATEEAEQLESDERLARREQFRREVAAAHADPDTYAPGRPRSRDPVEQVSVSVIGEGLIHLRGPIKGINTIRTMIDQIDSPLGQTRISVHTVQINGEDQSRMEDVANIAQLYIDQARFLTLQSSEMLRRAVLQVAARKAEEARHLYPGETQEHRDRRYLHAFFGRDFIDELVAIDSEFLHTGNKLLSLHSMDTTSLSSALNLMALAKNSTREEILAEFDMMVQTILPEAEARNLKSGLTAGKKSKLDLRHPPEFYPLAQRAQFESLRAFFQGEIHHDDTMTPLQREFIRLAQIFKSRLITEIEYKQRVMERAVIEDRFTNYQEKLADAQELEDQARADLSKARDDLATHRTSVRFALNKIVGTVRAADIALERVLPTITMAIQEAKMLTGEERLRKLDEIQTDIDNLWDHYLRKYKYTGEGISAMRNIRKVASARQETKDRINHEKDLTLEDKAPELNALEREGEIERLEESLRILSEKIDSAVRFLEDDIRELESMLAQPKPDIRAAYEKWNQIRVQIQDRLWIDPSDEELAEGLENERKLLEEADHSFRKLLQQHLDVDVALERVEEARRPLDHKKFLDMLIDQLEEKYIELLEGTRAHTANVDNYLKRLTTALDDDFNTQFYNPTFRYVRETSTYWDVEFGQTETTTILTNNRQLAKVSPSATMEFDLPKRDILINEALNGAMANVQDFGALLNDPTFLAAAQLKGPNPTSTPPAGSTSGFGVVRDVLPGLSTSTSEEILSQNADGRPQFGSNLENLIPDPAIYKFETGTGFEIRPVIQPDGQAVVFDFNYMYTTNVREPVRADEKHLGRVKRHYIDTDVQLSNFELREVSRYTVALKAARTSRGVPLLEDLPLIGVLWRPLPSQESSLQQNVIMAQATIFPTLFDLMGLRWAPAVADLDPLRLSNEEFTARGRHRELQNRVYDHSSSKVDEFLRIPEPTRRADLYRTQESVPRMHPNGYQGPGLDLQDSQLQEGYQPERAYPEQNYIPGASKEGAPFLPGRRHGHAPGTYIDNYPLEMVAPGEPDPEPIVEPVPQVPLDSVNYLYSQ